MFHATKVVKFLHNRDEIFTFVIKNKNYEEVDDFIAGITVDEFLHAKGSEPRFGGFQDCGQ